MADSIAPDTSEFTSADIHKKSLHGILAVMIRQVFGQGVNILAMVVLSRILVPSEFAVFAVLQFFSTLVNSLVGGGISAALVRQSQAPTTNQLKTATAIQVLAAATMGGALLAASPWLMRVYSISSPHRLSLLCVVAAAYLILALQTVPQALLERQLEFRRIAVIEFLQILGFNGVMLTAATLGAGGLSFGYGLMARAILGSLLFRCASPCQTELGEVNFRSARELLRYGLPFQATNAVAAFKDAFVPIFVASALGAAQVGYINWASMVAVYPVLILLIASRVFLPSFARLQDKPEAQATLLRATLRLSFVIIAPLAGITFALSVPMTLLIFGEQWLSALPIFRLLWIANLAVPATMAWSALLNSRGEAKSTLLFTVLCAALTWILGAYLCRLHGAIGFAEANAAVQAANLFLWARVRRHIRPLHLGDFVRPWGVSAAIVAGTLSAGLPDQIRHTWELALWAIGFCLVYLAGIACLHRAETRRLCELALRRWHQFRA